MMCEAQIGRSHCPSRRLTTFIWAPHLGLRGRPLSSSLLPTRSNGGIKLGLRHAVELLAFHELVQVDLERVLGIIPRENERAVALVAHGDVRELIRPKLQIRLNVVEWDAARRGQSVAPAVAAQPERSRARRNPLATASFRFQR